MRLCLGRGILQGSSRFLGRSYSQAKTVNSFYELFPQTFPNGGPPKDSIIINSRQLRREYRALQSEHHPDIILGSRQLSDKGGSDDVSSMVNRAYTTLNNPYTRVAHFLRLTHPEQIDITQDETAKELIAHFQNSSPENAMKYKDMLMTVLEAHEALEMATSESDLDEIKVENEKRIEEEEKVIDGLLRVQPTDWSEVTIGAIKLKYWANIQNALKEWEPGKPVHLTH